MKRSSIAFALGLLWVGLASGFASAATATASFAVSATVVSSCQASPSSAAFYGVSAARMTNAASSVAITCTLPTPYSVVARAVVASERDAVIGKSTDRANNSSPLHPADAHYSNEENLPPVTHSETIIVSVSY